MCIRGVFITQGLNWIFIIFYLVVTIYLRTAEHNLECKFELLKTIKNKIYFNGMNSIEIPIISGIVELILSLVTGPSKNEVEFILRRLGLFDKFHYKIYADDIMRMI